MRPRGADMEWTARAAKALLAFDAARGDSGLGGEVVEAAEERAASRDSPLVVEADVHGAIEDVTTPARAGGEGDERRVPRTDRERLVRLVEDIADEGTLETIAEWNAEAGEFVEDVVRRLERADFEPSAKQLAFAARLYDRFVDRGGFGEQVVEDLKRNGRMA